MAAKRMFAKSIIGAGRFLRMPATSRLLYYDLGMQADDDGVVEAYTVMQTTKATEDDLRVLVSKGYVKILNDDLVTYICDWRENNTIRSDRYTPSVYKDLLVKFVNPESIETDGRQSGNQMETSWQPNGNQMEPQDRLDKNSIDKDSVEDIPLHCNGDVTQRKRREELEKESEKEKEKIDYNGIKDAYNSLCPSLQSVKILSDARKKLIKARLKTYTIEQIHEVFRKAEASDFITNRCDSGWKATFDWIMKDANFAKVLDGNYDNRKSSKQPYVDNSDKLSDIFE